MSYIIKCDRCSKTGSGARQRGLVPEGWASVGWDVKARIGSSYSEHHFCPKCTSHLQIKAEPTEETSGEKLVAILESMVDEAVNERE